MYAIAQWNFSIHFVCKFSLFSHLHSRDICLKFSASHTCHQALRKKNEWHRAQNIPKKVSTDERMIFCLHQIHSYRPKLCSRSQALLEITALLFCVKKWRKNVKNLKLRRFQSILKWKIYLRIRSQFIFSFYLMRKFKKFVMA